MSGAAPPGPPPQPAGWRARRVGRGLRGWIGVLLPWMPGPVRPGEVLDSLLSILLDRSGQVSDVDFQRYAPNRFIIELAPGNYRQNYQPIEARILQQWQQRMQAHLATANQRQGRLLYRLGGPLLLELHPSETLRDEQARILYRLESAAPTPQLTGACLERLEDGRRWRLYAGLTSLGRDPSNEVALDSPQVQGSRLVSSRHAHLISENGRSLLFDGDPGGAPSVNGTYLNGRAVPREGIELHDGDVIILAALNPTRPDPYTPGVAALRYIRECA